MFVSKLVMSDACHDVLLTFKPVCQHKTALHSPACDSVHEINAANLVQVYFGLKTALPTGLCADGVGIRLLPLSNLVSLKPHMHFVFLYFF